MKTKITPEQRKKLIAYLKKFYEYYPGEKYTIFHFVRYFKLRLKKNKDAWMGVAGETGGGKSLFVIMSQILFGRPYDLIKNVSYLPKGNEIVDKFEKLNFQTFCIDEAAKEMRSVNWHSKAQQNVNTTAMTDRFKNNWIFLNMPNFNEFTKSMRLTNIKFRALVLYRTNTYARIVVQAKSRNWRSDDPWYDKKATDTIDKIQKRYKELSNDLILRIERNLPNTVMDFIIPNLELILPEVTNTYETLKRESRIQGREQDVIDANEKKKSRWRDKYQETMQKMTNLIRYNTLNLGKTQVTRKTMADALGVSTETFNKYLNKPKVEPSFVPKFDEQIKLKQNINKEIPPSIE